MAFKRSHINLLEKRIQDEPRKFIEVVYGPRQAGKTTLVLQFLEETTLPHHYASADAVSAPGTAWISQQWEAARITCSASPLNEAVLVIDEIQKITNWSEQVKKEWDTDTREGTNLKVILLGSSRLLLQQGLTESLAGRYETIYLGHWTYSEMEKAFGMEPDEYVWFGGYPGAASLISNEARWQQYIQDSLIETTISKDILMMTRIDKPALIKRLFEFGCGYSGQILSYNKMLGQLQDAGNTTTLAHYLNLLDTAGLLAGLEKFTPNKIRQRASSPKFQVHNTALMSALEQKQFHKVRNDPSIWGRWVESAVGASLLHYSQNRAFSLYYWRHVNEEVDFVLQKGDQVIGLEVKSGSADFSTGMDAFSRKFNPDKVLLVGDTGLPWQEFLKMNPADLFD